MDRPRRCLLTVGYFVCFSQSGALRRKSGRRGDPGDPAGSEAPSPSGRAAGRTCRALNLAPGTRPACDPPGWPRGTVCMSLASHSGRGAGQLPCLLPESAFWSSWARVVRGANEGEEPGRTADVGFSPQTSKPVPPSECPRTVSCWPSSRCWGQRGVRFPDGRSEHEAPASQTGRSDPSAVSGWAACSGRALASSWAWTLRLV